MSVDYKAVLWSKRKKKYDLVMGGLMLLYLLLFIGLQITFFSEITVETLIIRATGTLAFLMLHVILVIGPLSRINNRFLPLLYNRRHLGVTMFIVALVHGIFNLFQFHASGDTDLISSVFSANPNYSSIGNFPFQTLGFFALLILFAMAATSHDFWLKNLSPKIWKSLHIMVYFAYALIVTHVLLGTGFEEGGLSNFLVGIGGLIIVGLHIYAANKSKNDTLSLSQSNADNFYKVCQVRDIEENRAKVVMVKDENIAIFKYDGKLSAIHNVCKHQNGPIGEGKIVDGCITCPWHGYQYLPNNGQSPPPFNEKVKTYDVKVIDGFVFVNPEGYAEGTERPAALIK